MKKKLFFYKIFFWKNNFSYFFIQNNLAYFHELTENTFNNHPYEVREKISRILDLYYNRFNLESLRKLEEFDLKEIDSSSTAKVNRLNKITDNLNYNINTTNTNNKDENNNSKPLTNGLLPNKDQLEVAKIYNLKGLILLENGYFTKSQKYFKNASGIFADTLSNNPFHPLVLNNQYDELYSNAYLTSDFEALKNSLLELIARSQMIENSYMVFKGFTYLSLLFAHSGNHRGAKALAKYSLNQLPSALRREMISNAITLKCLLLYVNTNKNLKKDKFYASCEKELKNSLLAISAKREKKFIANTNNENNVNNVKQLSSQIELELLAYKTYQEAEFSLNFNTLYLSLDKLNSGIKNLEENNYRDSHMAMLYLKKWAIEILLGREATAGHYLDESQKIINSSYSVDSYKNIEFLRSMIINALNVYPPKIDLAREILRKTKKITEEVNCNSLQQKFLNIAVNLRTQTGVSEIFNLYEDILNTNAKYFKKDSEIMFDIKDMLKASRLGFVYKNKQDKKQN